MRSALSIVAAISCLAPAAFSQGMTGRIGDCDSASCKATFDPANGILRGNPLQARRMRAGEAV